MKKPLFLIGALFVFALAHAQTTGGAQHITVVVGGPPGTPGDLIARTLGEPLAKELGQPVVVENRPGAAGTLALGAVSRAAPDGSTLGIFALQSAVAPNLVKVMPYDGARDLLAVRQVSTVTNVLVVRSDSQVRDFTTLLRDAKQSRLAYASAGMGTPSHLVGELFAQEVKLPFQHVPFNGPAAALSALIGAHVDMMFATTAAALPLIRDGKLRPLAVTATQRIPALPEVPTLAELGHPNASVRDWHGFVAPAGTPPERIEQIAGAIGRALSAASVRERLQTAGLEPLNDSGPREFREFIDAESVRWSSVLRRAGVAMQ